MKISDLFTTIIRLETLDVLRHQGSFLVCILSDQRIPKYTVDSESGCAPLKQWKVPFKQRVGKYRSSPGNNADLTHSGCSKKTVHGHHALQEYNKQKSHKLHRDQPLIHVSTSAG